LKARAVHHAHAWLDLQAAGPAHPEHTPDTGLFYSRDDRCCAADLVIVEVWILPAGIESADHRVMPAEQGRKKCYVIHIPGFCVEPIPFFELLGVAHDRGD
jgi:hypothetical protein